MRKTICACMCLAILFVVGYSIFSKKPTSESTPAAQESARLMPTPKPLPPVIFHQAHPDMSQPIGASPGHQSDEIAEDRCSVQAIFTPKRISFSGQKRPFEDVELWNSNDERGEVITVSFVPGKGDANTTWHSNMFKWVGTISKDGKFREEKDRTLLVKVDGCSDEYDRYYDLKRSALFEKDDKGSFRGYIDDIFTTVDKSTEDIQISIGGYWLTIPRGELYYSEKYDDPIHFYYSSDEGWNMVIQKDGNISLTVQSSDDGNPLIELPREGIITIAMMDKLWVME